MSREGSGGGKEERGGGVHSSMHVATTKCVPYLEDGKVNSQSAVSQSVSPSLREERRRERRMK